MAPEGHSTTPDEHLTAPEGYLTAEGEHLTTSGELLTTPDEYHLIAPDEHLAAPDMLQSPVGGPLTAPDGGVLKALTADGQDVAECPKSRCRQLARQSSRQSGYLT